jgi:superfamily II DNA or RNA helicase
MSLSLLNVNYWQKENELLRGYQAEAVKKVRDECRKGKRRIMVQAATGAGKTEMAVAISESALAKGKRVAFCVPMISLVEQTAKRFFQYGMQDLGIIQGDHPYRRAGAAVQVCSLDTLRARNFKIDYDIIFIDEAHLRKKFVSEWMRNKPETLFIGLSATPWSKGLGLDWQSLVVAATTDQLINQGYLSPFRVFAPTKPDLAKLKTRAGDWEQKELGKRVIEPKLVASILETWQKLAENRPTIGFAVNLLHAQTLQAEFQAAGIPTGYIEARTDMDEREHIRQQFHNGDLKVVWNVGTLTTGVDWDVRCIILARPTKSEMLFVQMIGRGLRTAEGKQDCLILDHSDTHERLGFVTDIHHDSMNHGEKPEPTKREKPLPKTCVKCHAVIKGLECHNCGHVIELKNDVEASDGELKELRGKKTYNAQERQDIWEMLNGYAQEKGLKQGWVYHTCKEMTGHAPKNRSYSTQPPNEAVLNYIRYKRIKWSKGRQMQISSKQCA